MGPVIMRRALEGRIPYAVKIHGSALEYVVRPEPERFLPYAREGLDGAAGVLVGSRHTRERLWDTIGRPGAAGAHAAGAARGRRRGLPPRTPDEAAAEMRGDRRAPATRTPRQRADRRLLARRAGRRDGRSTAWSSTGSDRHVAFVGKLLPAKGIDLLLAAWPLVLQREPRARLVVVGFGEFRAELERLLALLRGGNLDGARDLAARHGLDAPASAFLAAQGRGDAYRRAAAALRDRVVLTGRLEHDEVATLVSACECQVVPSTFPEAFGMVVAEAAACGALPIVADHSGAGRGDGDRCARRSPRRSRDLMSFAVGPTGRRDDRAARASTWMAMSPVRQRTARATRSRQTAHERYSWDAVADAVVSAATGRPRRAAFRRGPRIEFRAPMADPRARSILPA